MKTASDMFKTYEESENKEQKKQALRSLKKYLDVDGNTALMHAAASNKLRLLQDLLLIRLPNLRVERPSKEQLILADCRGPILDKVLYKIADYMNVVNNNGMSAIDIAARHGHVKIVKQLLLFGASYLPTEDYSGSLYTALLAGQTEVADVFVKQCLDRDYIYPCIDDILAASIFAYGSTHLPQALATINHLLDSDDRLYEEWCDQIDYLPLQDYFDDIETILIAKSAKNIDQYLEAIMVLYQRQTLIAQHLAKMLTKYDDQFDDLLQYFNHSMNQIYAEHLLTIDLQMIRSSDAKITGKSLAGQLSRFLTDNKQLRSTIIECYQEAKALSEDVESNINYKQWYLLGLGFKIENQSVENNDIYEGISQLFFQAADTANENKHTSLIHSKP